MECHSMERHGADHLRPIVKAEARCSLICEYAIQELMRCMEHTAQTQGTAVDGVSSSEHRLTKRAASPHTDVMLKPLWRSGTILPIRVQIKWPQRAQMGLKQYQNESQKEPNWVPNEVGPWTL